ncbi:AraC family transcriptional regulator [Brucella pseudogrignonensis]|uniref:helix-turn-helix domain-containing protein n=1 Tax=Brucella pseudogrignonensis TaxID=419475 RepID=UPI00190B638B|nr:AraC family transcriptional regulator [Brucella pseudogrignonensis]MBK0021996.1 helix-turn-helix transcriptional regulator [Ochrobactrum sp. S45]MBK0044010.1 helix-turn-helix transcriptional regulator [Ochrobactrum sp. S46]MCD4513222.1 AraC family transcriptional regulator [Brucella pseudogrignonensis]UKK95120.1 AraC family transcriptional regulator [Brucella pseudogrignonensis]
MVSSFEEGHSGKDKSDAMDRAEQAKPGITKSLMQMSAMTVMRRHFPGEAMPLEDVLSNEDAFSITTQLTDLRLQKLWCGGSLVYEGARNEGSLAIAELNQEWKRHQLSPFDDIEFRIPFADIRAFAEEAGRPEFRALQNVHCATDNVVLGLARALLPFLDRPDLASTVFLEQIELAIMVHLTQTYGGLYFPHERKGTLSLKQERRAAEFLAAHLNADFSISDVADACGLSRSHFMRAFKETFGKTPYRWLIEYRIAQASDMLIAGTPIAEIALACGFADQSHFTRVFSEIVGEAPGMWRRRYRKA